MAMAAESGIVRASATFDLGGEDEDDPRRDMVMYTGKALLPMGDRMYSSR